MVTRILPILIALATACESIPQVTSDGQAVVVDARAAHFRTQAALLGYTGWHLLPLTVWTPPVTVSEGHTWWSTNHLYIDVNAPVFNSGDLGTEGDRKHWANRHLDVRQAIAFPSGTVIRSNLGQNGYLWYLDPDEAAAGDPRFDDAEALYYQRLTRLATLPLHEAEIERGGGGGLDDDLRITLPGAGPIMVVAGDVLEGDWETVGWIDRPSTPLNLFDEGSLNSSSVRNGHGLMQPLPRGAGLELVGKRGIWQSQEPNPATAMVRTNTFTLVWVELPTDW